MAVDPSNGEAIRRLTETFQTQSNELAAIRAALQGQGSWAFVWVQHALDFVIIALADIVAAGFVLITFDSWKESDRQNTERAQYVLGRLAPNMEPILFKLRYLSTPASGNSSHYLPWAKNTQMHEDLFDPALQPGSLKWEYPGGSALCRNFNQMLKLMKDAGDSITGGPQSRAVDMLRAADLVEKTRLAQHERYVSGEFDETWLRFARWVVPGHQKQGRRL